jgi:hypothetical protein
MGDAAKGEATQLCWSCAENYQASSSGRESQNRAYGSATSSDPPAHFGARGTFSALFSLFFFIIGQAEELLIYRSSGIWHYNNGETKGKKQTAKL